MWVPVPSRAMAVALLALFLNLAGVGYAATGGNFILGHANSASATTALTGSGTGAALSVTNSTSGKPAAAFRVTGTTAPFTVNSSAAVANLNADLLDGISSAGFVPSGNVIRLDGSISTGSFPTWNIGPFVSIGIHCYLSGSGSGTMVNSDEVLFNHGPTSLTAEFSQITGGQARTAFRTAPSGGSTVIETMSVPQSGGVQTDDVRLIARDNGETVTALYSAESVASGCGITGTAIRATS